MRIKFKLYPVLVISFFLACSVCLPGISFGAQPFIFTTVDVPAATRTVADGINTAGQIVGGYQDSGGLEHGFLLSGGSFTTLDYPGSSGPGGPPGTEIRGVNDSGQMVGQRCACYYGESYGFYYSGGSFSTSVVSLDYPGALSTSGFGINNAGQIVGAYESANYPWPVIGYLDTGGSFSQLIYPGSQQSHTNGINNTGQIVGAYYTGVGNWHGFLFSGGSYTAIDFPGATMTWPSGINDSGQVAGTYTDSGNVSHGFLLVGGTFTTIDVPGATSTSANGINNAGQIVGSYTDAGGVTHGFFTVNQWTQLGPAGVEGRAVAVSPNYASDNTIYEGTWLYGVYKSTNGGTSWTNVLPGQDVSRVAVSPNYAADQTVYAGTWYGSSGVFKSTNGGASWTAVSNGIYDITALALSPNYATDQTVYTGTYYNGLFKSTDGGTSWTAVNSGITSTRITDLAISPNYASDNTVFAGTDSGVFKSTNGGASWIAMNTGITNVYIYAFAVSPNYASDQTVYVGTGGGGVFKSIDGGASWTVVNTGLTDTNVVSLAVSPNYAADNTVYAGTGAGGVFKSTNGGAWTAINTGLPCTGMMGGSLAVSPNYTADHTIYAGPGCTVGVWSYTDTTQQLADTTPPAVSAGGNKTINAVFTQTATATDADSPALTYAWTKVSGSGTITFGSATALSTTISAAADGAYVIQFTATDAAGNSASSTMSLTWDTTPPVTVATPSGALGSNGWYASNVIVSLSAMDATSGVGAIHYTLDGGSDTVYSSPLNLTTEAQHTVVYYAVDNAGNVESSHTLNVNIDKTPPTSSTSAPPNGTTLSGTSAAITGTASDNLSGAAKVEVGITPSGGTTTWVTLPNTATTDNWAHWTYSWTLPANGSYMVQSRATDNAGNIEMPGTGVTVIVNVIRPASTITSPADCQDINIPGTTTSASVTGSWDIYRTMTSGTNVTLNAEQGPSFLTLTQTGSSIAGTLYDPQKSDGIMKVTGAISGANINATATFPDGINIGGIFTGTVSADGTMMSGTLSGPPNAYHTDPEAGTWRATKKLVNVAGTASDSSGYSITKVEVSVNGAWRTATDTSGNGSWSTWTYSFTPHITGVYFIKSRATNSNNVVEIPGPRVRVGVIEPAPTSISGKVSYAGTAAGDVYVAAFSSPAFTSSPVAYAGPISLGAYTIPNVPFGTYYIGAIKTISTSNIQPTDPFGCYGGVSAPTPVTLSGAAKTGIDITLNGQTSNPVSGKPPVRVSANYNDWGGGNGPQMELDLEYDDPSYLASGVTVSGPGLANPVSLTYNQNDLRWESWQQNTPPATMLTAPYPALPATYTFTVNFTAGGAPATYQGILKSYMADLVTGVSPVNDAYGTVKFSWEPLFSANYYSISLQDNSYNRIWPTSDKDLRIYDSSYTYDGPALTDGHTYYFNIAASDANDNRSYESGSFVYHTSTDVIPPASVIYAPTTTLSDPNCQITGTASDDAGGTGVNKVKVSIDGGTIWFPATDTSGTDTWSTWSFSWTPGGNGSYTILSRATDKAGNMETPGAGVPATVDVVPPTSAITSPADLAAINSTTIAVTGTAGAGPPDNVSKVDVFVNGVRLAAADTSGDGSWSKWSCTVPVHATGIYHIVSRATDSVGAVETPGPGIEVSVVGIPTHSISGTLSYTGTKSAPGSVIVVGIFASPDFGGGSPVAYASGFTPGQSYTISGVPDGTYYAGALKTVVGSGNSMQIQATDPFGYYNGGTAPAPVVLSGGNKTGINITLNDTSSDPFASQWVARAGSNYGNPGTGLRLAVDLEYNDPNGLASSVTVSGPGIDPSVYPAGESLIYNPNDGRWENRQPNSEPFVVFSGPPSSYPPLSAMTYTFTVSLTAGGTPQTCTAKVPSYMTDLVKIGSPSGAAYGRVKFSWSPLPTAYSYGISISDNNWNQIWQLDGKQNTQITDSSYTYDGTGYTAGMPALIDGQTYNYQIFAYDINDEDSWVSGSFVYHKQTGTAPPTSAIASPASGSSSASGQPVTVTGTASDDASGTGIKVVKVSVDGGKSWFPAMDTSGYPASGNPAWATWSFTWPQPADGVYIVQSRATDNALNVQAPVSQINIIVGSPQLASSIASPIAGAILSSTADTAITGIASAAAGLGKVEVGITPSGGATTWNKANGTAAWSYNWALPASGNYTIQSRATDAAGKVETPAPGITVMVTSGPLTSGPVSSITSPADLAVINSTAIAVTGTGSAIPNGIGRVDVFVNGVRLAAKDTSGNGSWSKWSCSVPVHATGMYHIVSQATDNAGNAETPGPGITVTVASIPTHTISGTVSYTGTGSAPGSVIMVGVFADPNFLTTGSTKAVTHGGPYVSGQTYTLSVPDGTYYVGAIKAVANNGSPDIQANTPYGIYNGGTTPAPVVVSGANATGINITLHDTSSDPLANRIGMSAYVQSNYSVGYNNVPQMNVDFEYDGDPSHLAASVTVTGPQITTPLSLVWDTNGYKGSGCWDSYNNNGPGFILGEPYPALPATYTFTVNFTSAPAQTYTANLLSCMTDLVTITSPIGNAYGNNVKFSWTPLPDAWRYGIYMQDASYNQVWSSDNNGNDKGITGVSSYTYDGTGATAGMPALTDGQTYNFDINANDINGNSSYVSGSFVYHSSGGTARPASAITSPTTGALLPGPACAITGTAADDTDATGIRVVEVSTNGGTTWFPAWDTSGYPASGNPAWSTWSFAWAPASTGSYTIKSRATDNEGNVETPGMGITITMDITPPTSTITAPLNKACINTTAPVTITGTASDIGSGVAKVELSFDGGASWTSASGTTSWNHTGTPPADGFYVIQSRATDNAGNVQSPVTAVSVTYDTTPPITGITAPAPSAYLTGTSAVITGTASDATSGVKNVQVGITPSGSATTAWYPATGTAPWSCAWTLPADGTYTITSKATDNAGNTYTSAAVSVTVDKTPPAVTITPMTSTNLSGTYATITGTVSDATSGVNNVQVGITPSGSTETEWYPASGTPSWSCAWTLPAYGSYAIKAKATDNAGNVQTSAIINVKVDTASPTSTIVQPLPGATLAGTSCVIKGTAADGTNPTGVLKVEVGITPNGGTTTWYPAIGTTSWSCTWTPLPANGSYTIQSRATNAVGTREVPAAGQLDWVSVTVDKAQPSSVITSPAPGKAVMGGSVTVTGTASGGVSGATAYTVTKVELSTDGGKTFPYLATGTTSWSYKWDTTTMSDGACAIMSRATSSQGVNVVTETTDFKTGVSVLVDNTPPTSGVDTPANPDLTGASYMITGTASDATSGVKNVQVGITPSGSATPTWYAATDTSGNGSWSTWRLSWTLPIDGSYIIKSRATDKAGNIESPAASVSVKVDKTPPTVTVTAPANKNLTGSSYLITGAASDAGSGVSGVQVGITPSGGVKPTWYPATDTSGYPASGKPAWSTWGCSWTLPGNGGYTITAKATDNAGNAGNAPAAVAVLVDETAPSSKVAAPANGATLVGKTITITGIAADNTGGSGVGKVEVGITGSVTTWFKATGTTSWSYAWTPPSDGSYTIQSRATDNAGNPETPVTGITIMADTAPVSVIQDPANGAAITGKYTIRGTATDAGTVKNVSVSTNGGLTWVPVTAGTTTWSYTPAVSLANGTYTIKSRATDDKGNIETPGKGITVTVNNTIPSAPTGVTATPGERQVTLGWTKVTGAAWYNVYWSLTSPVTKAAATQIPGITGAPYTVTGLTAGTPCYFVVTAANAAGVESAFSNPVSATPTAPFVVTTRSLPPAAAGNPYSFAMEVSGAGPFTWNGSTVGPTIASTGVPGNGMTISPSGGLSGTPYYSGLQPMFLTVQDTGTGNSVGIEYEFNVGGTGSSQNIQTWNPPVGTQGASYPENVGAGSSNPYTSYATSYFVFPASWEVGQYSPCGSTTWVFGDIPPGMTFNGLNHNFTGTPTFAGSYTFSMFMDPATTLCGPDITNIATITLTFNPAASPATPPGSSNWTRQGGQALQPGASGDWDGFMIGAPSVVKANGTYYLYYEGQSDTTYHRAIGLATSPDGVTWTKNSDPVLQSTPGSWDASGVRYPVVYYDGAKFWMWYQGKADTGASIGLATSTDGVAWTKSASNPVATDASIRVGDCAPGAVVYDGSQFVMFIGADGNIASGASTDGVNWGNWHYTFTPTDSTFSFARPSVVLDGTTYRMWYTRTEALGGGAGNPNAVYPITVGYADSPDGNTWTTYGNPVLTAGAAGAWDRPCVGVPSVMKDGATWKMWYTGGRGNLPGATYQANPFVEGSIGYAIIP